MNAVVSFEDSVKQRMKAMVADLLPEDRWNDLVASTITSFEKVELPKLIREELAQQYRAALAQEFAKPEWQARWSSVGGAEASPIVQKMLVEAAPLVLASMMGGAAQAVVSQLQYNLQNNRNY